MNKSVVAALKVVVDSVLDVLLEALLLTLMCIGLLLLLVVMRGFLVQTATDRAELEVVI